MKHLLYLILLTSFSLPILAKGKIFYYEYVKDKCYYALELDTSHNIGRLYACGCYEALDFIAIDIFLYGSFNSNEQTELKNTFFSFFPYFYLYSNYSEQTKLSISPEPLVSLEKSDDFQFRYDIKNDWRRLDYVYYSVQDNEENIHLSEFLKKYQINWFPPYFELVKGIDYNYFPKDIRKYIKKRRLK